VQILCQEKYLNFRAKLEVFDIVKIVNKLPFKYVNFVRDNKKSGYRQKIIQVWFHEGTQRNEHKATQRKK